MVVDTSVFVAIALNEPAAADLSSRLARENCIVSTSTVLESHMVLLSRAGYKGVENLEFTIRGAGVVTVPFDEEQLHEACSAFERYGKGRHPAALNFGDCMAYALSKVSGQPLLYIGDDFSKTDVVAA